MEIEASKLYQALRARSVEIAAGPEDLVAEFRRLRVVLVEHGKYIVTMFPEYTPHDTTRHLDHLFLLADRVLGTDLYARLSPTEVALLAFGLYAHDWGMAISQRELQALRDGIETEAFSLPPGEPASAQRYVAERTTSGRRSDSLWMEYLRVTHGLRSGARLRTYLRSVGGAMAEAVARIAEGHTLDARDIRDVHRYPLSFPVFGETVNLAALSEYVRIIDLLDIGEDRTPYALWKFVAPLDPTSSTEWSKHRALSPAAVRVGGPLRLVTVGGVTDDPAVYAALADLREWVTSQFANAMVHLRHIGGLYDVDLDSRIEWSVQAHGFEPVLARFELDRDSLIEMLGRELYGDAALVFVRELLQNSVDAIEAREDVLSRDGSRLTGTIVVRLKSDGSDLIVEWSDNGIGMDAHIVSGYLSRIGRSWYQSDEYRRLGLQHDPISRFGLGLLSCFRATASLVIETRKEPQLGAAPGYRVEIRDPLKYFRIQRREDLNIGTTVTMRIPAEKGVSKEALVSALRRTARYVRHSIEIDSDGVVSRVGSFGRAGAASSDVDENLSPQLRIISVDEESVSVLDRLIQVSTVAFGGPTKDYEGYFSAALPRDLRSIKEAGGYRQWQFGDEVIDLQDYLASTEQAVFVKGVMVSGGERATHLSPGQLAASADSGWFSPRMMVNVRRPSNLNFNLARDRVRPQGLWIDEMWREIAGKLYGEAFGRRGQSVEERALRLGGLGAFAGLPVGALKTLCAAEEIPTVVLEPGRGLVLSVYGELGAEFMEAPYELSYKLFSSNSAFNGFGEQSGLDGWEGERALVLGNRYSSPPGAPWMGPIDEMVLEQLLADKYVVSEIALLRGTERDRVPLVAHIWRRGVGRPEGRAWTERAEIAIRSGGEVLPSDILTGVCEYAPLLVKFPAEYQRYAAIGSRYWNTDHEKARAISMGLLQLGIRVRKGEVEERTQREFSYFTSHDFLGYIVPSRVSGRRLALEMPAQLLALAERGGMVRATAGLEEGDFLPRTIGKYANPYHYDLGPWRTRGSGLGSRIT